MKRVGTALYWILFWISVSAAIIAVGALLGSILWLVIGTVAGDERSAGKLLSKGASIGWRYARVWAGGIAFILCFVKGYHRFSVRAYLRERFASPTSRKG